MEKRALETQVEDVAVQAGGILRSKYGLWTLGAISFAESALLVPLVTDPFLVAYILADKKSVYKGVAVALCTSLVGGMVAYVLAFSFYEFIAAKYLVGAIGEEFYTILPRFQEGTFVVTLLGAVTPVPYTLVALAAGFIKGNFLAFVAASLVGRGLRYILVGWLTYSFGERALSIAQKQIKLLSIVCIIAAIIYFFVKW